MGYITFSDATPFKSFCIPNYVIKTLYLEYFIHLLKEREGLSYTEEAVQEAILQMAFYDNVHAFFEIIENTLKELSDRDYQKFNEKHIKILMFGLAMLSADYYHLKSEREGKGGYTDILFLEKKPYEVYHQYAFELKYLKKEQANQLEATQEKAAEQLRNYINQEASLRELDNLQAFTVVVVKDAVHLVKLEEM